MNKEHQITWMLAGGGREMNALLPVEVRQRAGHRIGLLMHQSGQLREAGAKGAVRSKEIAAEVRARLGKEKSPLKSG